jgi:hypothetical protein
MTSSSESERDSIEVPIETREYCKNLARRHVESLDATTPVVGASMRYHLGADALAWSDELPQKSMDVEFKRFYVVLLQLRTRAILGTLDPTGALVLSDVQKIAPNWAFCQSSRYVHELSAIYLQLRGE